MLVRMWRKGILILLMSLHYRTLMEVSQKIKIRLPFDPANTLLAFIWKQWNHYLIKISAHPCSLQNYSQYETHGSNINVHQQMNGQGKCDTHTMEYYLSIKNIQPFATARLDLETFMPSKVKARRTNTVWSHLYMDSKKLNYIETERLVVTGGEGVGKWREVGQRVQI